MYWGLEEWYLDIILKALLSNMLAFLIAFIDERHDYSYFTICWNVSSSSRSQSRASSSYLLRLLAGILSESFCECYVTDYLWIIKFHRIFRYQQPGKYPLTAEIVDHIWSANFCLIKVETYDRPKQQKSSAIFDLSFWIFITLQWKRKIVLKVKLKLIKIFTSSQSASSTQLFRNLRKIKITYNKYRVKKDLCYFIEFSSIIKKRNNLCRNNSAFPS